MKLGTATHPKFKRLLKKLKLPQYAITGILESIWSMAAQYAAETGDLSRFNADDIADYCEWDRDADELVNALVECRWLDRDERTGRLVVHDWLDHRPGYINERLRKQQFRSSGSASKDKQGDNPGKSKKKQGETLSEEDLETVSEDDGTDEERPGHSGTVQDIPGQSGTIQENPCASDQAMPCHAMPSHAQPIYIPSPTAREAYEKVTEVLATLPEPLRDAWEAWHRIREGLHGPMPEMQQEAVLMELLRRGENAMADLQLSIQTGAKNILDHTSNWQKRTSPGGGSGSGSGGGKLTKGERIKQEVGF